MKTYWSETLGKQVTIPESEVDEAPDPQWNRFGYGYCLDDLIWQEKSISALLRQNPTSCGTGGLRTTFLRRARHYRSVGDGQALRYTQIQLAALRRAR